MKDHADGAKKKHLTLRAGEFIRRFLLHVLPHRFVRIRHYGLLAARNVRSRLAQARLLLAPESETTPRDSESVSTRPTTWWQRLLRLTGIDVMLCPYCDGRLVRLYAGLPARSPP